MMWWHQLLKVLVSVAIITTCVDPSLQSNQELEANSGILSPISCPACVDTYVGPAVRVGGPTSYNIHHVCCSLWNCAVAATVVIVEYIANTSLIHQVHSTDDAANACKLLHSMTLSKQLLARVLLSLHTVAHHDGNP